MDTPQSNANSQKNNTLGNNGVQSEILHTLSDNEYQNSINEIVNIILSQETLSIYNTEGKRIFYGTLDQLLIFRKNKDYGTVRNIASIGKKNGETIIRFGKTTSNGFYNRKYIFDIFAKIVIKYQNENSINNVKAQIEYISNEIRLKYRHNLYDNLFLLSHGIFPDSGLPFETAKDLGIDFDAHGISKSNQLSNLFSLLENGIDKNKPFYSAPFDIPTDLIAVLGPALGTSGGSCYKDGLAVICSGYKKKLLDDGIEIVFISDIYGELLNPLQKLFPQYKFYLLSQQVLALETAKTTQK